MSEQYVKYLEGEIKTAYTLRESAIQGECRANVEVRNHRAENAALRSALQMAQREMIDTTCDGESTNAVLEVINAALQWTPNAAD